MSMSLRTTPEEEFLWREAKWAELKSHPTWPNLSPSLLREMGLYGGAAGIWVDKATTGGICETGIAVSVLHTGKHYDDDVDDQGVIYHYPTTKRHPSFDDSEINSVKQASVLQIPIFVILNKGKFRHVRRAWITDHDDVNRLFLLEFGESQPEQIAIEIDMNPFKAKSARKLSVDQIMRVERSPRFKFEVVKRHSGRCVVTGLGVIEMLDGAHVVPVSEGGSDDPRNGLLLSASHHRAYDKHLWCINPKTLEIETSPKGPSLRQMKFEVSSVEHLAAQNVLPHGDALEIRYEIFSRQKAS
jgi:putative restriction endonuclease